MVYVGELHSTPRSLGWNNLEEILEEKFRASINIFIHISAMAYMCNFNLVDF